MSADLASLLRGAAASRQDSISGLDGSFQSALQALVANAPEDVRPHLAITSAYRDPNLQAKLFADAVKKYGSEQAARKWVAPPGKSNHNHGRAVDLQFGNDAAKAWAHANATNFGLAFPMAHEPWHVELANARAQQSAPQPAGQPAPQMPPQMAFGDLLAGQKPVEPEDDGLSAVLAMATKMQGNDRAMQAREQDDGRRRALLSLIGAPMLNG